MCSSRNMPGNFVCGRPRRYIAITRQLSDRTINGQTSPSLRKILLQEGMAFSRNYPCFFRGCSLVLALQTSSTPDPMGLDDAQAESTRQVHCTLILILFILFMRLQGDGMQCREFLKTRLALLFGIIALVTVRVLE